MSYDNKVREKLLYDTFNVTTDEEKKWVIGTKTSFSKFYDTVKQQPISSFIRALEVKCRGLKPVFNQFFKIEYSTTKTPIGYGELHHLNRKFYTFYEIGIPEPNGYNEIDIRNIIAHEAAHLYSAVYMLLNQYGHDICSKKPTMSFGTIFDYMNAREGQQHSIYESKANVVGTLILNARADFYRNRLMKNQKCFCSSFEQIVKDMQSLRDKVYSKLA